MKRCQLEVVLIAGVQGAGLHNPLDGLGRCRSLCVRGRTAGSAVLAGSESISTEVLIRLEGPYTSVRDAQGFGWY